MTILQIEKKRLAVSQISLLWLAVSVLVPVLYFGANRLRAYDKALAMYAEVEQGIKASVEPLSVEQMEAFYKSADAKKKRETFLHFLFMVSFEIFSVTGLLFYRHRQEVLITLEEARRYGNQPAPVRLRELIPFP